MTKRAIVLWGLSILLLACLGCSQPEEPAEPAEDGSIKIGFSMATLMEDRWLRDRDIFLSKAQQREMEVVIRNANKDSDMQFEQVKELLEQDIDVLVIAANDAASEARCVEAAKAKGVPVIIYDRLIWNSAADVYISFDSHMVGRLMAEYLLEYAPTGGYLLVNGPQTDNNCLMIREGYMEVLQPRITKGDIWVMGETWSEGWVRENAYDYVIGNASDLRGGLTGAICENDSLAWGVSDAFSETRIDGVAVVGMDADLSACQRIVAGRQAMTIYKPIQVLVTQTLEACEKLATGQPLETTQTIHDGVNDIPYIAIEVYPVTLDTMEETVIADGFHLKEEIFGGYSSGGQ